MKIEYLPNDYRQFDEEYDKSLELLKQSEDRPDEFCDLKTMVERTEDRFETMSAPGPFQFASGLMAKHFAEETVEGAVRILSANKYEQPVIALREVELTYLAKTDDDGSNSDALLTTAKNIGDDVLDKMDGESDTPYPFSYLREIVDEYDKAHSLCFDGSVGGLVANIVVIVALAGVLGFLWLFPPVEKLFANPVPFLLSFITPFAVGIFVWRKFRDNIGVFSGCLGYLIAGALGFFLVGSSSGLDELNGQTVLLSISVLALALVLVYWIPSLYRNIRYTIHRKTSYSDYTAAKERAEKYILGIISALDKVKRLTSPNSPGYQSAYRHVTTSFSVTSSDGVRLGDAEVWNAYLRRINAAWAYYDRARRLCGL